MFRTMLLALLVFPAIALSAEDRQQAAAIAAQIDKLVDAGLAEHGVKPNPRTGDEQFARRAYLDIAGRIPTYRELTDYLESKEKDKRLDLIDSLLESEGYVSHTFNYWSDVLRIKTRLINQVNGTPYMDWVKRAIRDNMPYDQFVRDLLTGEGKVTDNGAAGYYIRDSGMPLDNLANTIRIFLGTRLVCAQCHDHPFDKWTQYEYYELAAYVYGVDTRQRAPQAAQLRSAYKDGKLTRQEQQILQRLIQSQSFGVRDVNKKLKLPDDYKYHDYKPGEVVKPRAIFGPDVQASPGQAPRQVFASWVTSPENPRFAQVIANRLWKRAMGLGLVEPVDEFTDATRPFNPALLEYLSGQIKELGYDTRALSRAIYYSKSYQRQASTTEPGVGKPYYFPGPTLRRMTAEQLWDSLMTLIVPDLDGRQGVSQVGRRYAITDLDLESMTAEQVIAKVKELAAKGRGRGMKDRAMDELMKDQPEKYRGLSPNYVRASEWIAPAQPGTFVEQFGASDRELIDSATTEPTITQALEMLNGPVTNTMLSGRAVVAQEVLSLKDDRERVRVLFLSILGREPSGADRELALSELKAKGNDGLRNLGAALLNTREFMFVQ